jgi:hypothetical protein
MSPPCVRARHTPNFATSAAKLVCRASRKGCSTWPGLEPRPTSNLELDFEAILNFSPLPKVVISVPGRGVTRLLSFINMRSKRPAPTSAGSPSTWPPAWRFRLLPVPPPLAIGRLPHMQLNYSTPHISQRAAYFTTGELNKVLSDPVAAKEHGNEEVRHFYLLPEQNITRAPQRVGAAPPILRSQPYAKRP